MEKLWPAGVVLVVAILIAVVWPPASTVTRLTNMDLSASEFPDTYLMISKTDESKAYVVDRRDSTIRRSNNKQPGRKWDVFRISDDHDGRLVNTWMVQSKKKGKGTVFFLPAIAVDDWSYPFFYDFVSKQNEQLQLPKIGWTQLYVNRIYEGLYLRVALPFDLRKKDGGSGVLREIFSVDGDRSYNVDTRFESIHGLYADKVSESFFPQLDSVAPDLAWLGSLNSEGIRTFVMSNIEPFNVSYWPLPVSLPELYEDLNGSKPESYLDERFQSWAVPDESGDPPFGPEVMQEMREAFARYSDTLAVAVRLNGEFRDADDEFQRDLQRRQYAAEQAGLDMESN